MYTPKPKKIIALCKLDERTVLAACRDFFVLQRCKKAEGTDVWENKYFYSEATDALRAYVRLSLSEPKQLKQLDGTVNCLLERLDRLEKLVRGVGEKVAVWHVEQLADPIEEAILRSEGNDDD